MFNSKEILSLVSAGYTKAEIAQMEASATPVPPVYGVSADIYNRRPAPTATLTLAPTLAEAQAQSVVPTPTQATEQTADLNSMLLKQLSDNQALMQSMIAAQQRQNMMTATQPTPMSAYDSLASIIEPAPPEQYSDFGKQNGIIGTMPKF